MPTAVHDDACAAADTNDCPRNKKQFNQQIYLFHGDKGGVGKSFTTQAFADNMLAAGLPLAVIDADTRNPDVIRMFDGSTECQKINLRRDDGWMEVIDFIKQHADKHIAISLPAGIGEAMQKEFVDFCRFLKLKVPGKPEVVMFWVINLFPDCVNLLADSLNAVGEHVSKVIVVRNTIFGDESMFFLWDESPLKAELEKKKISMTISMPALHLRVTSKIFADPECMMPFSKAATNSDAFGLTPSEQFKLETWVTSDVKEPLDKVRTFLKL